MQVECYTVQVNFAGSLATVTVHIQVHHAGTLYGYTVLYYSGPSWVTLYGTVKVHCSGTLLGIPSGTV